jgi:LTR polyprotein gag-polypeptide-like protein
MQIVLTLKDEPLDTIIDTDTAEECWERLLKRYKGKGTQRKMQLFKEIFKSAFTNTDPLEPQINSLLCLVHAVKNLGWNLGDDVIVPVIILALPASLGTLKTVLANASEEPFLAELKAQILANEQHWICESGIGKTAFFTKAAKKTKDKDNKKVKKCCTHCNI